ncbi:Pyridoxal reductase [Sphaceloma murrayae]|uniref:Pyridoxal reductase n=1 Tax=Sphaceloma murrayae TaxID=2082308 RepID=A0A2K1QHN8_9PEZI|nr:Pyridoxal reductase [Sphaceloma murrayae]
MSEVAGRKISAIGYGLMGKNLSSPAAQKRQSLTVSRAGLTWREKQATDEEAIKCMETAFENGINFWNGGEFYGPIERNSLHILNAYFTKHPEQADKVVISIKGGAKPGMPTPDGRPENIRRSIDECLKILDGKKFLDIFECARVDPKVPIEESIGAIAEYVKAGKVGAISLSECSADSIRRAAKVHKIACVEVEVSLWATEIFENGVAQTCAELDIPIVAYSPLGSGFLTGEIKRFDDLPEGDFRRMIPKFQPGAFEKNLDLVHQLQKIADKKGCTPGQIAVAWVLKQASKPGRPKLIPIPGATKPQRIVENNVQISLSANDEAEIQRILDGAEIVGGRYPDMIAMYNFGDSPPLQK